MLRQETLVKAVCDYCRTPATAPRGDGDATLLFTDETEARELLGLDNGDPDGWRELDNSLLICPLCARARDCVLGGPSRCRWAPCGCETWLDARKCHTTENRRAMSTSADEHPGGRDERS